MLVSRTVAIRLQATSLYHVLLDEKSLEISLERYLLYAARNVVMHFSTVWRAKCACAVAR